MADTRVEQRVGQVKKYVEKNKGWRPGRRTIIYLGVMIVALAAAAIVVPRVLPGTINNSESLLGRGRAIEIIPLSGGAFHRYVPGPPLGEGYTCWSMSESREEVVVGWFRENDGVVEKVSVQSRSAFSGRLQVEWTFPVEEKNPKVAQVGFLPRHNQIWFLSSGRLHMIDIKSGAVLDYPFKGQGGSGSLPVPAGIAHAGFSPKTGKLAYVSGGKLVLVTGLGTARDGKELRSRPVLKPGATKDAAGRVIEGTVDIFGWIEDDLIAAIVRRGSGASAETSLYYVDVAPDAPVVHLKVPAPEGAWFISLSESPTGTEFAVLLATGAKPDALDPNGYSLRVYTVAGKQKNQFRLPAGRWRPPLSWESP